MMPVIFKRFVGSKLPKNCSGHRVIDIIVITVHDRFWNVGQANCILKYFENMMIDHSHSTIF
jgi:hypothetical protein